MLDTQSLVYTHGFLDILLSTVESWLSTLVRWRKISKYVPQYPTTRLTQIFSILHTGQTSVYISLW